MRVTWLIAAAASVAACGDDAAKVTSDRTVTPPAASAQAPAGPAEAASTTRGEIREFRDWRAVCDNGNACVAWTGSSQGGWLRVGMEAGPDVRPTVTASEGFHWGDDPSAVRLKIDGREIPVRGGPADAANADASEVRARNILSRLAVARSAVLELDGRTIDLPTAGASAALLWIDERQGRLGTTTALLRRGERPRAAVPAAPALPVVRPAPPVAQGPYTGANSPTGEDPPAGLRLPAAIEALDVVKACREESNPYMDKAIMAVRLDASTVLWGVPCGSGAYNATYSLFLAAPAGGNVRQAELPTRTPITEGDIAMGDTWLVNPVYDTRAQTLTIFPRGRGLGDCGTITSWAWTADGFALTEERFMGDCQGMNPDQWPTTWRTRD